MAIFIGLGLYLIYSIVASVLWTKVAVSIGFNVLIFPLILVGFWSPLVYGTIWLIISRLNFAYMVYVVFWGALYALPVYIIDPSGTIIYYIMGSVLTWAGDLLSIVGSGLSSLTSNLDVTYRWFMPSVRVAPLDSSLLPTYSYNISSRDCHLSIDASSTQAVGGQSGLIDAFMLGLTVGIFVGYAFCYFVG